MYRYLSNSISPPPITLEKLSLLEHLWKSYAPSKVIVFTWQLLLGRLPTRDNLETQQMECLWCPLIIESESHLFRMCPFANGLWYKIYKWLGVSSLVHSDPLVSMGMLCLAAGRWKGLKGLLTVWHAMMWTIWRARNEFIFSSNVPILEECFDIIKRTSWKWLVGKKRVGYVFIMNGALIQWIVYLDRAYCHSKSRLDLFLFR
jgi:hypothetical protein